MKEYDPCYASKRYTHISKCVPAVWPSSIFFCGAKDLKPTYETEAGVGARPGNLKLGIGLKAIAFSLRAKARVELSEVRHRAS